MGFVSGAADPKPRPRIRATSTQWRAIRMRKLVGRPCRICETDPATNLHHLVPRSQGGDDVQANLVELCGSGTTGCHGRVESRDVTARETLRTRLTFEERLYVVERKGPLWLDDAYPLPAIRCAS